MSASLPYSSGNTYPAEAVVAAPATDELASAARVAWWFALGAAVLGLLLGIAIIAWPDASLKVVAALFGIWLLVHGVVRIVQAITATSASAGERAILGVIGVLFVVSGVIALRNLLASLALVITLVGITWLIGGIMELISAFGGPAGGHRLWRGVLGALGIVAALVVFVWPEMSLVALVYVTGAWLIVMGVIQVGMVLAVRRAVTA